MINRERIIREFCDLVEIDAISFQERRIADVLKKKLSELGFEVTEDNSCVKYNGNCGNVYGYLKGDLEGPPLLFSAHMDTVEPGIGKKAIRKEDGLITSDGTTVLGADDLAGIASILEAVRSIKEMHLPHRSIEVLLTFAEEAYIRGSEVFDFSVVRAKEAYVLDLDGPVGTAARKAPTLVAFSAKITGKASHAGFAPEQGIHAIAVAAEAITKIRQGRIDVETTVNIGTIEGGKARNIVPEQCLLQGEVRSLTHEKAVARAEEVREILQDTATKYRAKLEFSSSYGCLAYEVEKDHPVIKRFEKVCRELNYPVSLIETFGGSDNNNFVLHGIIGIVVSCGMNKVHSLSEYTHVDELERCSNIVLKLMIEKD